MSIGIAGFFALGVLTWTFLEYVMHRWVLHDRRFRDRQFVREHIRHHVEGHYFAPSWLKAVLAALLTAVLAPLAVIALGAGQGLAYIAGLFLSYAAYEVFHRREHTHPGLGAYGRWARRLHFYHHFEDARMNHGVTSPLWDIVFGTYRKPGVIHVPHHLCMSWLRDPETGRVRDEHAATFVIEAND